MKTSYLFRVVSLLALVSSALTAQIAREHAVPLKNPAASRSRITLILEQTDSRFCRTAIF